MRITVAQLKKISRGTPQPENMQSIVIALNKYGGKVGLDMSHRLAHYIPQLAHESGHFRYDKEIWGNTPAQVRYDTRTDLGNTPAKDGDGKKYMGRTGIQLTGKANYQAFTKWVKSIEPNAPDFVENPELVNTDPWEGLAPIWFWTVGNRTGKSLNAYADKNDIEMITRIINGGLNGYADRIDYYVRTALVLLDYPITKDSCESAITAFQQKYKLKVDGAAGPQTRSKLHTVLAQLAKAQIIKDPDIHVTKAPVTQTQEVAVAPSGVEKPGKDITAIIVGAVTSGGAGYVEPVLGTFGGLTPIIQGLLIAVAVAAIAYLIWTRTRMAKQAKTIVADIKKDQDDGLPN